MNDLNLNNFSYNKISDDVYLIGKNTMLKMNVNLIQNYVIDNKNKKVLYHREIGYFDDKSNTNLYNIKRSFDYFLSIENIKPNEYGFKEFIRIGLPEIMLLRNTLMGCIKWFNDSEYKDLYACNKDTKELIMPKKAPKIVIDSLPQHKFIALTPTIISFGTDEYPGVRMYLNSETNFVDISVPRFMGFVQAVIDVNLYMAAQNLLNYFGRPPFGSNIYIVPTTVNTVQSEISVPINRKISTKSNRSEFDKLL